MMQNEPTERAPHGQSWKQLSKKKKKSSSELYNPKYKNKYP